VTQVISPASLKREVRRRADTVSQFGQRTGFSRAKVWRGMKEGLIHYVQIGPNGDRRIPHSEYKRLGFDMPSDETE
jgi:hypothetical protein